VEGRGVGSAERVDHGGELADEARHGAALASVDLEQRRIVHRRAPLSSSGRSIQVPTSEAWMAALGSIPAIEGFRARIGAVPAMPNRVAMSVKLVSYGLSLYGRVMARALCHGRSRVGAASCTDRGRLAR